jgi:hypothetical protein
MEDGNKWLYKNKEHGLSINTIFGWTVLRHCPVQFEIMILIFQGFGFGLSILGTLIFMSPPNPSGETYCFCPVRLSHFVSAW